MPRSATPAEGSNSSLSPRGLSVENPPAFDELQDEATWLEWRSLAMPPTISTELVTTEQSRREFLHGARLLMLDKRRRYDGRVIGPTPIQLVITDVMNSPARRVAILEPRRTTKTTAIQATLLGRCSLREDYIVGWTLATTGQKAAEAFKKMVVSPIERLYPDPKTRPFKVNVSNGHEHVRWPEQGSWFNVYSPDGDGFRSGAYNVGWLDEAGEASQELGDDIKAGVLPTLDTSPDAQFIVSGTAAAFRGGNLLWDFLHEERAARLAHMAPEGLTAEELEAWEADDDHPFARVRELVELYHPGVGWTTPLDAIESNFPDLRKAFPAEYLGIFGVEGANTGLIPAPQWEAAALDTDWPSALPKGVPLAIGVAVHPDRLHASLAVAWLKDGLIYGGLGHHQHDVRGFGRKLLLTAKKLRVPVAFDTGPQSAATGVEVEGLKADLAVRPRLRAMGTADVRKATTKLLKALEEGTFRHYRNPELDNASLVAVKRRLGDAGAFTFGRPKDQEGADITPLEALALAIHSLDEKRDTPAPGITY